MKRAICIFLTAILICISLISCANNINHANDIGNIAQGTDVADVEYRYPEGACDFYIRNNIQIPSDFYRPDVVFKYDNRIADKVLAWIFDEENKMYLYGTKLLLQNENADKNLKDDDKVAVYFDKRDILYEEDENGSCVFKDAVYKYLTETLKLEVVNYEDYADSSLGKGNTAFSFPIIIGTWRQISDIVNNQSEFIEGCGYTTDDLRITDTIYQSLYLSFVIQDITVHD